MKVAVTGARGFIGRRIVAALAARGHEIVPLGRDTPPGELEPAVAGAEAVMHLAAVNRPASPDEFAIHNTQLTERIAAALDPRRLPVVVFSSSYQATHDTPYGRSKRGAEDALQRAAAEGRARVALFRLPNVFGPGARPNYNSVVATFAHNAARGLALDVHDPAREVTLVYVHDVAAEMVRTLDHPPQAGSAEFRDVRPHYPIRLDALAQTFLAFADTRNSFRVPDVGSELSRRLYATYLSHVPQDQFGYPLRVRSDERGALAEFLKSDVSGQIFVSRSRPGVTRGNHFHFTKTEKFLVLEGDAIIRFRPVDGGSPLEYRTSGRDFRVVDIPPDYTHSIENVGNSELVVLFWASEIFDPDAPDTHPLSVL